MGSAGVKALVRATTPQDHAESHPSYRHGDILTHPHSNSQFAHNVSLLVPAPSSSSSSSFSSANLTSLTQRLNVHTVSTTGSSLRAHSARSVGSASSSVSIALVVNKRTSDFFFVRDSHVFFRSSFCRLVRLTHCTTGCTDDDIADG